MAITIDQAFVKQFEREVHEAYQRQGSKLRSTVRTIGGVKGASTTFQKVGKGSASTKSTHVYKRSEEKKATTPGSLLDGITLPKIKPAAVSRGLNE